MVFGLVLYDFLFIVAASGFYGGAVFVGVRAFQALALHVHWSLAIVPAMVCAVFSLIVEVFLATSLCPPLKPGRYRMMKSVTFFSWVFRSMFRRILLDTGLRWLVFSSNVLRFLALRALGAKVHLSSSMSMDVMITDPALVDVHAGAMLGARSLLAAHMFERGRLILGRIEIGEGSLLATEVICAPGVVIGKNVIVKGRVSIAPYARIDDGADIGAETLIDTAARVGKKARIDSRSHIKRRQVVEDGARFP
jgi:carbonic anhydrase/acetyltransferase-like protein (isoleucine patch superfamily)